MVRPDRISSPYLKHLRRRKEAFYKLAVSCLIMSESSESPIGGFALQGSSSSFSQRQAVIFGDLQALEDAHRKVEEETSSERLYVQQFWRETKPAVESLEAEKEARDRKARAKQGRAGIDTTFRVPAPPSAAPYRRRAVARRPADPHRDSSKWTYYSLADVDEDAASNREVAAQLIQDLRRRRELAGEGEGGQEQVTRPDRILFRPTRGRKKARLDADVESDVCATTLRSPSSFGVIADDEEEEEGGREPEDEQGRTLEADPNRVSGPVFRRRAGPRASKSALRHRLSPEGDDAAEDQEEGVSISRQQQSSTVVDSSSNEEEDRDSESSLGPEDSEILEEDAPEGI
ncbi:hypothetical protein SprV_0802619400 [Sparganum proliferum]